MSEDSVLELFENSFKVPHRKGHEAIALQLPTPFDDCGLRIYTDFLDPSRSNFREFLRSNTYLTPVDMGFAGHHVGQPLLRGANLNVMLWQQGEPLEESFEENCKLHGKYKGYLKTLAEIEEIPDEGIKSLFFDIMQATKVNIGVDLRGTGNLFIAKNRLSLVDLPFSHPFAPKDFNHQERIFSYLFSCMNISLISENQFEIRRNNGLSKSQMAHIYHQCDNLLQKLKVIAEKAGLPSKSAFAETHVSRHVPNTAYRYREISSFPQRIEAVSSQPQLRKMIDIALEIGGPHAIAR